MEKKKYISPISTLIAIPSAIPSEALLASSTGQGSDPKPLNSYELAYDTNQITFDAF